MRRIDAVFSFNLYLKSVIDILTNDGKIWMKIAINNRIGVISIQFFNYLTSDNVIFGPEKSRFCLFGIISYHLIFLSAQTSSTLVKNNCS